MVQCRTVVVTLLAVVLSHTALRSSALRDSRDDAESDTLEVHKTPISLHATGRFEKVHFSNTTQTSGPQGSGARRKSPSSFTELMQGSKMTSNQSLHDDRRAAALRTEREIEAGLEPILATGAGDKVKVTGLIDCLAVFVEHYCGATCGTLGIIGGHFVTANMFSNGGLTSSGTAFVNTIKQLMQQGGMAFNDGQTELTIFAATKLDGTCHAGASCAAKAIAAALGATPHYFQESPSSTVIRGPVKS